MENNQLDPKAMWRDIDRFKKILDGDDDLGIVGLRDRIDEHAAVIAEIRQYKIMLRGILIGLAINLAGVVAVALKVLEN